MSTKDLVRVYYIGGPWDLTCKTMDREDLYKHGGFVVVRHPGKRVHTEYSSKGEAVAVFAQVTDFSYRIRQIGSEVYIAVAAEIER